MTVKKATDEQQQRMQEIRRTLIETIELNFNSEYQLVVNVLAHILAETCYQCEMDVNDYIHMNATYFKKMKDLYKKEKE